LWFSPTADSTTFVIDRDRDGVFGETTDDAVDTDGNGSADDTLFFYPANNGTPVSGSWQTWNAGNGVWTVNGDPGDAGSVSLADYVVAHPDAKIVVNADPDAPAQPQGGTAFLVGGGGAGQTNSQYFLDNITIGTVDAATGHTVTSKRFDLEQTAPTLTIGDTAVSEGNFGATLTFPVTLSRPFAVDVTAHYATADSTATAPGDYTSKSGTVTIPAGSTTGSITVVVVSDKVREAPESVHVTLSGSNYATLTDGLAVGTIVNDDTTVSLAMSQATERRVRVTVGTLPHRAGQPVKVFRVLKSGYKQMLSTQLNGQGRVSALLPSHYSKGDSVTMYAVVYLANGKYVSKRVHLTIQ
jgi:hypothetical protein